MGRAAQAFGSRQRGGQGAFGERIVALATRLAEFSETPDGLTCTYLTPTHRAVAAQLRDWMTAAGMTVTIDAVGNVVGRYAAADPAAKTLIVGSHYDTVLNAGNYDGRLGILTGLVAVEQLNRTRPAAAVPSRRDRICRGGGRALFRRPISAAASSPDASTARVLMRRDAGGQTVADLIHKAGFDPDTLGVAGAAARRPAGLSRSAYRAGPGAAAAGLAGRGRHIDRRDNRATASRSPA